MNSSLDFDFGVGGKKSGEGIGFAISCAE